MTDEQIKHMVDRFLGWPLPRDFRPDDGISFVRTHHDTVADRMPTGTNVLDASQAEAMVHYMLDGLPEQTEEIARALELQHAFNLRDGLGFDATSLARAIHGQKW